MVLGKVYDAYKAMPYQKDITAKYNEKLLGYRLKNIERRINFNTPELKQRQVAAAPTIAAGATNVVDITSILQGDALNEREGHRINVRGIKLRIYSIDKELDHHLILSPHGVIPTAADFQPVIGGHVFSNSSNDIKELHFFRNYGGANGNTAHSRKFKNGLPVKYSGSGGGALQNRLTLVTRNATTGNVGYHYSIVLYYTDA